MPLFPVNTGIGPVLLYRVESKTNEMPTAPKQPQRNTVSEPRNYHGSNKENQGSGWAGRDLGGTKVYPA